MLAIGVSNTKLGHGKEKVSMSLVLEPNVENAEAYLGFHPALW